MLMTIVLSFIAVPVFASSGVRRVKKEPVGGGHVIAVQAQNDDQVFVRRAQKESASVVVSPQGRVDDDQGVRRHSTKQTQLDLACAVLSGHDINGGFIHTLTGLGQLG